ncbi:hypothetical protein OIU76_020391 [Salix suchowensis]|nr:hypothetical protein OIU76_020391 [Salix suchowensis]
MDNDDDFTFCQAGLPVEKNGPEAESLASDIRGIIITDGFSNGTNSSQGGGGGGVWRDSLPSDADSKNERTIGSQWFEVRFRLRKGLAKWIGFKLTRTHPDLAGLKGQSNKRLISMDEVKQHQTEGSMWTVLKGRVYNLSPYLNFHPGGVDILMKAVGKDCTSLFNKYHAWVNAEFLLEKCLVGTLDVAKLTRFESQ